MKKNWVLLVALIVIAAGIWWFYQSGSGTSVWAPNQSPQPTATQTVSTASTHKKSTPTPTPASYSELVQQYGSNRIQFDQNCQAQPKTMVLKNGTHIMLDNRSSQARTISFDGKSYNLAGYGYQIVTLSSTTTPKTISFQCGNSVNVGTVQLEANISGQ